MQLSKVAIVGGSGYSGEELIRILSRHPGVELCAVTSRAAAGKTLAEIYPHLAGARHGGLRFSESNAESVARSGAEFALLALPHGLASEFASPLLEAGLRVIDLSADFRIKDPAVYAAFYGAAHPAPELLGKSVYGLPEIYRELIRDARLVASAGCYPTSVLLPLIPLLRQRLLRSEGIVVTALSGVSGAGRKAEVAYSFCETAGSMRQYGAPRHRHLPEIEQELAFAAGRSLQISFTPHLIPVPRGILTTIHATPGDGIGGEEIGRALGEAYEAEPFVRLLPANAYPDTKHVVGSNFIDIAWRLDPRTGALLLMSAEDNLVKGAAGQAVQSLNLMAGCAEQEGLL